MLKLQKSFFYSNNSSLLDLSGKVNCKMATTEVIPFFRQYKKLFDANLAFIIRELIKTFNSSTTKFLTVNYIYLFV